jgi:tRNA-specific 2-thiouridylase
MSGGVDSAVAAGLMVREGWDVVGVTLRLWAQEDAQAPRLHRRCCSVEDLDDARAAADAIGIPHYVLNMEEEFATQVVDYFVDEYRDGRTPNPCLPCNEFVKFGALLDRALAMDADVLVTGHYAQIERRGDRFSLLTAADVEKDQSYVLYMLDQTQLSRLRFPIGQFRKDEVRELAHDMSLPNAAKPDSADICFLPTADYRAFISERVPQAEGDIVDSRGGLIGRHDGIAGFTIGQRRGLGVAVGEKRYVTAINAEHNVITIGTEEDLLATGFTATDVRWITGCAPAGAFDADVRVRYRGRAHPATVRTEDSRAEVTLTRPQRAIAPGQAAVFYRSDEVLGGGIIASAGRLTASLEPE